MMINSNIEPENVQRRKFPSPGRCIYCGSDGGVVGLRDEHIIPFALGGRAKLEKASCRECEKITSYLDGYLARRVFQDFRLHASVQTRNRRERPTKLSATVQFRGREETRDFPILDHPYFTVLPAMQAPGIFLGETPSAEFRGCKAHAYYLFPDHLRDVLGLNPEESLRVRTRGELNFRTFSRAIAKIAYCNAVCKFGLDGFRPLVMTDIILDKYPSVSYFVGASADEPPPPGNENVMHTVTFSTEGFERLKLLVASVRLFANSGTNDRGMPIYEVVVGAPKVGVI